MAAVSRRWLLRLRLRPPSLGRGRNQSPRNRSLLHNTKNNCLLNKKKTPESAAFESIYNDRTPVKRTVRSGGKSAEAANEALVDRKV